MAQYSDFKTTGQLSKLLHLIYIKDKKNSIRCTCEDDFTGKRYVYFALPLNEAIRAVLDDNIKIYDNDYYYCPRQVDAKKQIDGG